MTPQEVEKLLESTGALRRGHFQLSSGLHSPVYVQCAALFEHPMHTSRIAGALAERLAGSEVQAVVAPALGGIVLGYELARQLGARALFVERTREGKFELRRFRLKPSERVLVAEDVLTTGGSTKETLAVVRQAGAQVVGVAALFDRSGGGARFGVPLHALLAQKLETYPPDQCPLCRDGRPVVKPGSRPEARRQGGKEARK